MIFWTSIAGLGPTSVASLTLPITGSASIADEVIPLTGAQTYAVDLAMMPAAGLQGLKVSVDRLDAAGLAATASVRVTLTPGGFVDVMPGGAITLATPATAAGITGLSLVSTANALVRVSAIG